MLFRSQDGLGWRPQWSNAAMLVDSYEWYCANRAATSDGPSHHRTAARQGALVALKTLTRLLPSR